MSHQRPWLMKIYPLWLREKIFYRWYSKRIEEHLELFGRASLEFCSEVSLYDLTPTDLIAQSIAFTGFYELAVTTELVGLAGEGGLLIDVGANCGYYSCLWAGLSRENRCLALEPSPRVQSQLKENIAGNHMGDQVEILSVAAGRRRETMEFCLGDQGQTGWGGLTKEVEEETIQVEVVDLDSLLDERGRDEVDVLKIDTEGADLWVLEGIKGRLESGKVKWVFFEKNEVRMEKLGLDPESLHEFFQPLPYLVKQIGPGEFLAEHLSAQ